MDELTILAERSHELARARRLPWKKRPLGVLTDEALAGRVAEIHQYIAHCRELQGRILAQVPQDKVESHSYLDHLERRRHFVGAKERLAQLTGQGQDYLWALKMWAEWLHGKEWISSEFYRSLNFEKPVLPEQEARRRRHRERGRRIKVVFAGLLAMVEERARKNGEQPSWARQQARDVWNGGDQREKGAPGLATFAHELAGAKLIDGKYTHKNAERLIKRLWQSKK